MGHCHASLPLDDFDCLVSVEATTAPSKDPFSPSAFTAPEPTVSKAATPWLPSARPGFLTLTAPLRLPVRPGLVPSRTARGVHPSGLSPFAEPWHLSVLPALLTFSYRRPRPTDRWPTRLRESRPTSHLRREAQEGQAPRGADPGQPNGASSVRPTRTVPCGATSAKPQGTYPATRQCRTPNGTSFAFRALLPAKSSKSSTGLLDRVRGRCPLGLHLSRARSHRTGLRPCHRSLSPPGLRQPHPQRTMDELPAPQGIASTAAGCSSCEGHRPS